VVQQQPLLPSWQEPQEAEVEATRQAKLLVVVKQQQQ